jgi:hypothetical protein
MYQLMNKKINLPTVNLISLILNHKKVQASSLNLSPSPQQAIIDKTIFHYLRNKILHHDYYFRIFF